MAETLDIGRVVTRPERAPPQPKTVAPQGPASKPVAASFVASLTQSVDERRLFVLLPFALITGLIVSVELPAEPQPIVLAPGAAALSLAVLASTGAPLRLRLLVLALGVWTGLCLLPIHGALFGTPMLARPAFGTYQARVDQILSETASETRLIVSQIVPTGTSRALPVRRARVLVKSGPALAPGDVIAGPFRFAPVPGPVYPGAFDAQFHGYFDGIGAYGNSTSPPAIVTAGSSSDPAHVVDGLRRFIAARIDAVLGQPAAGIARAIIIGDQSEVTDEARDIMATAGIAHVLSVSGLHLSIVAGGVFWFLRIVLSMSETLARRVSIKRVAAIGGIAAALFYFAISGGNVAAFRSTLMILLVFGAVLFGRRALTMRNVAIAGLVVVASDPASVFRPSFQLSFAAVLALVGAYENLRSDRNRDASLITHAFGYAKGIVITSLVAGAATLLFSIYHFQQTSPLGVLGNLASLSLVGFVMMPAAVVAVLAMPFGIEAPFLLAVGWAIDRMLEFAAIVAAWSAHLTASPLLTPLALVIGLAALAWFALFRDRWRLIGPALAVPMVALFAVDRAPDVLVADTTQAMAVRGAGGLELAAGKSQSFALDVWRETYGEAIDTPAAQSCDSVACIGDSAAGFSYAIVDDPDGFAEECGRAALIVTRLRAPSYCAPKAVVDADDLASGGVQWLAWNAASKTFEVRPSVTGLDRPWRIARR